MRLRRRTLLLLMLSLLATISVAPARAVTAAEDPFATSLEQAVPELLAAYEVPGLTVAAIQNGDVVWSKGFGYADTARQRPMTADHILMHGSNGKVITTWAVLRLVEEGKVDLDAPVQSYVKSWQLPPSPYPSRITVRKLLTHTSGLAPKSYLPRDPRFPVVSILDSLNGRNYGSGPVVQAYEPGRGSHYSGAGFAVAQLLVEEVTGESFEAYTKRVIFEPLGMTTAAWHWTPAVIAQAATPYDATGEPLPYYDLSEAAVGGEMMTAADFARFVAAAVTGPNGEPPGRGVLKPETIAQALTPQPGDPSMGLGYGIDRMQNGKSFLMHRGANPGWQAVFALQPESGNGFVAVANSDRADRLMTELIDLWSRAVEGTPLPLPADWSRQVTDPWLPLRNLLTGLAALLGVGLIPVAYRVWSQTRRGTRRWGWSVTALVRAVLITVLVAVWVIFFHTEIQIPWPPSWLFVHWPAEIRWVTLAVVAWASLGIVMGGLRPDKKDPGGP